VWPLLLRPLDPALRQALCEVSTGPVDCVPRARLFGTAPNQLETAGTTAVWTPPSVIGTVGYGWSVGGLVGVASKLAGTVVAVHDYLGRWLPLLWLSPGATCANPPTVSESA
jgi:hypothetical protein